MSDYIRSHLIYQTQ